MKNFRQAAIAFGLLALLFATPAIGQAVKNLTRGTGTIPGTLTIADGTGNFFTQDITGVSADWTFTWPTTDGTNGQVMKTDGSGNGTWSSLSGFGVTTFADTTIPYASDTDTFSFDATNFNWVDTSNANALTLGAGTAAGTLILLEGSGGGTDTVSLTCATTLAGSIEFILPDTAIPDEAILFASAANTFNHDGTNFVWDNAANAQVLTLGAGTAAGTISFLEPSGAGTNIVNLTAPAALAGDIEFVLPNALGAANQVMIDDGSGNLSFAEKFIVLATNTAADIVEGNEGGANAFLFSGDGDLTWDANYFNAGQTSHVLIAGYLKSDDTGTETIDFTFKIGSTEFLGTGVLALAVEEEAGSPWFFECEIIGTGTNTQIAIGSFTYMFNGTSVATVIPFHKTLTETTANTLLFSATVEWANGAVTNDQATMTMMNVTGVDFN